MEVRRRGFRWDRLVGDQDFANETPIKEPLITPHAHFSRSSCRHFRVVLRWSSLEAQVG